MINSYKNRAMFLLFGIILVINIILMSTVFFAYSSIVKKDYEEKLTTVSDQTAVNTNRILSFLEEEIEVFINKNRIEQDIENFRLDGTNYLRIDSTSFERITIFKGTEIVYSGSAEIVDFYRQTEFDKKIIEVAENDESGWIINEEKELLLNPYESLFYVRTLFDRDTNERIGCSKL